MIVSKFAQIGIVGSACALMLFASDFWKTKDSSVWTDEEINKMLSDSPWAKAKTVQGQQQQTQRRGMGRRGGFGFPGGGLGGGYPGGGGGYPGGGGGYPGGGGGGYPAGGGSNGDPSQNEPMNLTIRWASAAPIQQALMRQGASASDELKALQSSTEKYYVISVLGLRMPRQNQRRSSTVDADNPDDNGNGNGQNNPHQNDALRSQLLDAAQLAPKGKSSIYAQDVQIEGPGGIDGVRFLFPRTTPISAGDKEVDFILDIRRVKVDEKFKLGDMQYEGKLAL
jgi:Glycine rich protein family